ncbi:MAG: ferredoxin-type protein NapF [Aquabacterium sp.]
MDFARRMFLRRTVAPAKPEPLPMPPLRPPWSPADDARFAELCTQCGACTAACPRDLIRAGPDGLPELSFDQQGCDLCGACLRACEPGALSTREADPPLQARARLTDGCLTRHGIECRICGDTCDSGALRFVPGIGTVSRAVLDPQLCVGCGACAPACPVRAISVRRG